MDEYLTAEKRLLALPMPYDDGDVVVSTRVRLARAYDDLPFISEGRLAAARVVERRVCDAVSSDGAGFVLLTMRDLDPLGATELSERGLVSREWLKREKTAALLISRDGDAWIVLNEDDPVRVCAAAAGLQPRAAYALASSLESRLSLRTPFARSDAFGFLTARPEDAGTGLRVTALMHLPMVVREEALDGCARGVQRRGLTLHAITDEEGHAVCDLYALSTPTAFDRTVPQALEGLEAAARDVARDERARRTKALADDPVALRDAVFRSLGALRYALRMDAREFCAHWSNLRLGLAAHVLPGEIGAWDKQLPRMQNAHVLRASIGKGGVGSADVLRCKRLRETAARWADIPAP